MVEAKAKSWGNSLGIIIPSTKVKELEIHEGDELEIEIRKKGNVLKELFGALDFKGKSTEELLKESRELESKWL